MHHVENELIESAINYYNLNKCSSARTAQRHIHIKNKTNGNYSIFFRLLRFFVFHFTGDLFMNWLLSRNQFE